MSVLGRASFYQDLYGQVDSFRVTRKGRARELLLPINAWQSELTAMCDTVIQRNV